MLRDQRDQPMIPRRLERDRDEHRLAGRKTEPTRREGRHGGSTRGATRTGNEMEDEGSAKGGGGFESGVLNERRWCARVVEGGLHAWRINRYMYISPPYTTVTSGWLSPRPPFKRGLRALRSPLYTGMQIYGEPPRCLIEIRCGEMRTRARQRPLCRPRCCYGYRTTGFFLPCASNFVR